MNIFEMIGNLDSGHWFLAALVIMLLVWTFINGKANEKAQALILSYQQEIAVLKGNGEANGNE